MTNTGNNSPLHSFASKKEIILGILIMIGISSIILLLGNYIVNATLLSFQPLSSLLYLEMFLIIWIILMPINTIINVKIFIKYLNRSGSFTLPLSTK
ncbi:MAG TPA: hypothetical protein VN704_00595, partial [Verrucomicrobiae bacterium]|nr:hypothetical protein [Verrucomicrobiae bacterium]